MGTECVLVAREDEVSAVAVGSVSERHTKSFANEDAIPHALDASAIFGIASDVGGYGASHGAQVLAKPKDENENGGVVLHLFFFLRFSAFGDIFRAD